VKAALRNAGRELESYDVGDSQVAGLQIGVRKSTANWSVRCRLHDSLTVGSPRGDQVVIPATLGQACRRPREAGRLTSASLIASSSRSIATYWPCQ
jgi:hypothetical protein